MICGPARLAVDVLDVGDDAVAGAVRLARRLLAEREHALGAVEVDDEVVALLEAAHGALDELALAVLELVEDEVALFVADALEEDLLGGLRGDAPEGGARLLHVQEVAELLVLLGRLLRVARVPEDLEAEVLAELGLEASRLRVLEGDLAVVVGRVVDDGHVLEEVDLAGVLVEARLELAVRPEDALRGLQDGLLDGLDEARRSMPFSLATISMAWERLSRETAVLTAWPCSFPLGSLGDLEDETCLLDVGEGSS